MTGGREKWKDTFDRRCKLAIRVSAFLTIAFWLLYIAVQALKEFWPVQNATVDVLSPSSLIVALVSTVALWLSIAVYVVAYGPASA